MRLSDPRLSAFIRGHKSFFDPLAKFSSRNHRQRFVQIGDQVVGVLQADREAQQVLRGARGRPLDTGAVLDEAVRAAQAGGAYEELALRRSEEHTSELQS